MNNTNTMKISESPSLAQACEFLKNFPTALVAGGVARDIILGQDFNDVDIYMESGSCPSERAKQILNIQRECQALGLEIEVKDSYYPYSEVGLTAGFLDICIIHNDTTVPEKLVETFDMVASQAWLEFKGDVAVAHSTKLFKEFNEHKVLGYYPSLVNPASNHTDRIFARYPDYLRVALIQHSSDADDFNDDVDEDLPF